jgi:chromate reductase, NAD(P)H dehydrogenase (quinone)
MASSDMPIMQQPEAYVGHAATVFAEDGGLSNEGATGFFKSFIDAFAGLIERAIG